MSGVLFIRHAETGMAGTFCGHTDPDINERGRHQVQALVSSLAHASIRQVWSSDLRRARTTAHAIAQHFHVELCGLPGLREMDFGQWEGLRWQQIEQGFSLEADAWLKAYPTLAAPGGEAFPIFEQRCLRAMEFILEQTASFGAENTTVAVVTHAGVLRVLLQHLTGCTHEEAWQRTKDFCSVVPCSFAQIQQCFGSAVDQKERA